MIRNITITITHIKLFYHSNDVPYQRIAKQEEVWPNGNKQCLWGSSQIFNLFTEDIAYADHRQKQMAE